MNGAAARLCDQICRRRKLSVPEQVGNDAATQRGPDVVLWHVNVLVDPVYHGPHLYEGSQWFSLQLTALSVHSISNLRLEPMYNIRDGAGTAQRNISSHAVREVIFVDRHAPWQRYVVACLCIHQRRQQRHSNQQIADESSHVCRSVSHSFVGQKKDNYKTNLNTH